MEIELNPEARTDIIVVDNFLKNPIEVREFALGLKYQADDRYFKGKRSVGKYLDDKIGRRFEQLLGKCITKWDFPVNGSFQICLPSDPLVYHMDSQRYAATIYLTPDAPFECGTSFYASKVNGIRGCPTRNGTSDEEANRLIGETFQGGFLDKTKFDLVDQIGNVFNRLVIWDAKLIHAASQYFGQSKDDSRLFQMFFFDAL